MSIQFQRQILDDGIIKLYSNISGINPDNTINIDDFILSIYAINKSTLRNAFSFTLNYNQAKDLFNYLNSVAILREGSSSYISKFTELTEETSTILSAIETIDVKLLKLIFNKANDNDKLNLILEALSESEIQNLHAAIRQTNHERALTDLQLLLELEESNNVVDKIELYENLIQYTAGQSEKTFQNWIEKNTWCLGIDYIKKHPARQIGIKSESDIIMETTDGFIDLIELKRPKFDIFSFDESHKTYYPSKELSKVIGQCLQYLIVLENYKLLLEKQYKFKVLKPRIKIIIGRTKDFNDDQLEALRILNSSLNHISIISYDYLYLCGKNIISYYSQKLKDAVERGSISPLPLIS